MPLTETSSDDVTRIVEHVVNAVRPLRVVLFGSRASGTARAGSDIDLMVVMPDGSDCAATERTLYTMDREGVRAAVDFVVTTPTEFERLRHRTTLVYRHIANEGRDVYAA